MQTVKHTYLESKEVFNETKTYDGRLNNDEKSLVKTYLLVRDAIINKGTNFEKIIDLNKEEITKALTLLLSDEDFLLIYCNRLFEFYKKFRTKLLNEGKDESNSLLILLFEAMPKKELNNSINNNSEILELTMLTTYTPIKFQIAKLNLVEKELNEREASWLKKTCYILLALLVGKYSYENLVEDDEYHLMNPGLKEETRDNAIKSYLRRLNKTKIT